MMCWFCGPAVKGTHRRWVHTGSSSGTFVSRRSFGGSSRSYTGLRTLCDNCARSIDDAEKRNATIGVWVGVAIACFIGYCIVVGNYDKQAKAETARTEQVEKARKAELKTQWHAALRALEVESMARVEMAQHDTHTH